MTDATEPAGVTEPASASEPLSIAGVTGRTLIGFIALIALTVLVWPVGLTLYVALWILGVVREQTEERNVGRRTGPVSRFVWWWLYPGFVVGCVLEGIADLFSFLP